MFPSSNTARSLIGLGRRYAVLEFILEVSSGDIFPVLFYLSYSNSPIVKYGTRAIRFVFLDLPKFDQIIGLQESSCKKFQQLGQWINSSFYSRWRHDWSSRPPTITYFYQRRSRTNLFVYCCEREPLSSVLSRAFCEDYVRVPCRINFQKDPLILKRPTFVRCVVLRHIFDGAELLLQS